jgi:hypothetical protein
LITCIQRLQVHWHRLRFAAVAETEQKEIPNLKQIRVVENIANNSFKTKIN